MTNPTVPPPPLDIWTPIPTAAQSAGATAVEHVAPLDLAFLKRTYTTTLWLGGLFALCAYGVFHSVVALGSFAGGVVLGALLLKAQESLVRRAFKPRGTTYRGWDSAIPLWIVVPLKYAAVGAAFSVLLSQQLLHGPALVMGLFMVQVVIVARLAGRILAPRLRAGATAAQFGPKTSYAR